MQIKLIAMDLDGTLMLPDHQRVGEATRRALAACRQQGVRLALATGRTLALTEPVQAQLPFLDYIVFSNGAGVWDVQNKKRIHSDPMQLADARQICAYLDSRPVYYEFYADGVPVAPARRKGMARLDGVPDSFVDELLEKVVYRDSVADALVGMTVEKLNLFTIPSTARDLADHGSCGDHLLHWVQCGGRQGGHQQGHGLGCLVRATGL